MAGRGGGLGGEGRGGLSQAGWGRFREGRGFGPGVIGVSSPGPRGFDQKEGAGCLVVRARGLQLGGAGGCWPVMGGLSQKPGSFRAAGCASIDPATKVGKPSSTTTLSPPKQNNLTASSSQTARCS